GWVVTKRTLVLGRRDLLCSLAAPDTRTLIPARVAAVSAEHDLALLRLDGQVNAAALAANGVGELRWAAESPRVRQFVAPLPRRLAEPPQFAAIGSTTAREDPPSGDVAQIMLDVEAGPGGAPVYKEGAGRPPGLALVHAEAEEFRRLFRAGDV